MAQRFNIFDFNVVADIQSEEVCENFEKYIESAYKNELADEDDRPLVYIGMALAILNNNLKISSRVFNLTVKSLEDSSLIERIKNNQEYYEEFKLWKKSFLEQLKQSKKEYKKAKKYASPFANWQKDDYFAINASDSELDPKYVMLRVVDKVKEKRKTLTMVYLCFLPDFKLPSEPKDLQNLVYIPNGSYERTGNITILKTEGDCERYNYRNCLIDDYFEYEVQKEIKFLGNYKMPFPEDDDKGELYSCLGIFRLKETVNCGIKLLNKIKRFRANKQ